VTKAQSLRADFAKAVARLDEALALPKDPIVRDSAKNLFPLGIQRRCYRRRPILDRCPVLRNYTVHTYNEQLANYVYSRLAETARRFRAVLAATEQP
jgi:hypothetical protein